MSKTIRSFVVFSQDGVGKTSLIEAMLYTAKAINKLGSVVKHETTTDYDEESFKRDYTTHSAVAHGTWQEDDFNVIDTPGFSHLLSDTKNCISMADACVLVTDATHEIDYFSKSLYLDAVNKGVPVAIFINKMDKEKANFEQTIETIKNTLNVSPVVLTYPMGAAEQFTGIVNLIDQKAYSYPDTTGKPKVNDIPDDLKDTISSIRNKTLEDLCLADDKLMDKYLETEDLSQEDIVYALKKGFSTNQMVPVFCGSGIKNMGIEVLLNVLTMALDPQYMKSEYVGTLTDGKTEATRKRDASSPFSGQIFKTFVDHFSGVVSVTKILSGTIKQNVDIVNTSTETKEKVTKLFKVQGKNYTEVQEASVGDIVAIPKLKDARTGHTLCNEREHIVYPSFEIPKPVLTYALTPASQKDDTRMLSSLEKIAQEDIALHLFRDPETSELLLGAQGQTQIDIVLEMMKRKFQIEVKTDIPKIRYRETITKKTKAQGKYKKQTGGHGQYGDAWIEFEPLARGKGFQFVNKVVGGSIPKQYIPAVEKGLNETLNKGFVKGYPVIDLKATVCDGTYHDVDSSEFAFKMAASLCFRKAMENAAPIVLEPIMDVELTIPEDYIGDVMGDLNSRRGRIMSMDSDNGMQLIKAQVPQAELLNYAPILQSITQGKATYTMDFSHYDPMPQQNYKDVPSKLKKDEEEEEKKK